MCPHDRSKLIVKHDTVLNKIEPQNKEDLSINLVDFTSSNDFEMLITSCEAFEHDTYGPE